ncbi:MAG: lactate racemase domain-containing protein [Candidatus Helarchaeota archaeon]
MTQEFKIPWGAWSGKEEKIISFPDSWKINFFEMKKTKEITKLNEIEKNLSDTIGTPEIEELAQRKKNAVIVVDDISRPTKARPIINLLLKKLNDSGISDKNITIIGAVGAHRPMNKDDFEKKIGQEALDRVNVENHHPYENLVYVGKSKLGTPIYVNKTYYEKELKIAVSSVIPHPLAGFGGGAKIILPGICGIQTLEANHQAGIRGIGVGLGFVTELRKDIEEVCSKVGLDFSINIVTTINRGYAGIFAGHFIDAHRKAMELANEVYFTEVPRKVKYDVGFFNMYPEDTELSQSIKGFNTVLNTGRILHRRSSIIFTTASTEGRGYHSLLGETGAKLYQNWGNSVVWSALIQKRNFGVISPNITKNDVFHYYARTSIFHKEFDAMIKNLEEIHGDSPSACIFPTSIQLTKIINNK